MGKLITWFILWILSTVVFKVLSVIGFIVNFIIIIFHKNRIENFTAYFKTLAVGEDQVGGSYLYRTEDWTVSSYNYYLGVIKGYKIIYWFMKLVDFFPRILNIQKEHCKESYIAELSELQNQHIFNNDTEKYRRNTSHTARR